MYKYVGKYRVVCEFDWRTLKPNKEDTYIYCANKGQIYRYNNDMIVYYKRGGNQSNKLVKTLMAMGIDVIKDRSTSSDLQLYFHEKDIDKICQIFKARILGNNIKPYSKRNLKLFGWFKSKKHLSICRNNG